MADGFGDALFVETPPSRIMSTVLTSLPEFAVRLTPEQVKHIATLCRIGTTEEDVARFQDQLSNILEQFEKLKELDTANVPPTAQPFPVENVFRADAERPSLPVDDILRNAPQRDGDFLRIKAVLEE